MENAGASENTGIQLGIVVQFQCPIGFMAFSAGENILEKLLQRSREIAPLNSRRIEFRPNQFGLGRRHVLPLFLFL